MTLTLDLTIEQSMVLRSALAVATREAKHQLERDRTLENKYMTEQVIQKYKNLDNLIIEQQRELIRKKGVKI